MSGTSETPGKQRCKPRALTKKQIGHSTAPLYAEASLYSRSDSFLPPPRLVPPLSSLSALATSSTPHSSSWSSKPR